jgi:Sigma-54 interaction domain
MKKGAWANVPPKRNRSGPIFFSCYLYRARNQVERFFNRIKHRRCSDNSSCGRAEQDLSWRSTAPRPPALLESELFGHVKDAFSGAVLERKGAFREANGGTLFLDEIGDVDLAMQAKILRAIQELVVTPVGAGHRRSTSGSSRPPIGT